MAESPRPLWLARDELLATLLDVSSRAPPAAAAEIGALRLEVRVDGVSDPIHWLAHTPPVLPRVYFRDQYNTVCVAGVGVAERVRGDGAPGEAEWRRAFAPLPHLHARMRYYGGMRFDMQAETGAEWRDFGGWLFVLPLLELQLGDDGACYLACHLRWRVGGAAAASDADAFPIAAGFEEAAAAALTLLRGMGTSCEPLPPALQGLPCLLSDEGALSDGEWEAAVGEVLAGIDRGDWSKVVLANRSRLRLGRAVDPVHLLLRLWQSSNASMADQQPAALAAAAAATSISSAASAASTASAPGSGAGASAAGSDVSTDDEGLPLPHRPLPDEPRGACGGVCGGSPSRARGGGGRGGPGGGRQRRSYLLLLQLEGGPAFLGCTPEKLFQIAPSADGGARLSTEAIAGTRRRGDADEEDAALARELLASEKDLREVRAVSDFILSALRADGGADGGGAGGGGGGGGAHREVLCSTPRVLQLRHVQHIAIDVTAELPPPPAGASAADGPLGAHAVRSHLELLHPTPAVCGTPKHEGAAAIRRLEGFDRGFYAGPFGYLGSAGSELCVAIRSALLRGDEALVYAGAGIVRGSKAAAEREEVRSKMRNFVSLLPAAAPLAASPFSSLPNPNALFCSVLLEELLRCGLAHAFICPGSRSSALTAAVAASRCPHTIATDERGAAFMAVGYARATRCCAAVIVTSGTAVANLLPAVVEAATDRVPLLLLTADRPPELRDTGANQTVPQVGLLHPLRWFKDMPPPSAAEASLAPWLADASYALAAATRAPAGPVQLNLMFREPLAPTPAPWPPSLLDEPRVAAWLASNAPFTSYLPQCGGVAVDASLLHLASLLAGARRGLVVAGALHSEPERLAAAAVAARLGWPLLPDINSGLRATAHAAAAAAPLYDLLLASPDVARAAAPDVVLVVGGRLVSKRLQALVERRSVACVMVDSHAERHDPAHCVTHRLAGDVAAILAAIHARLPPTPPADAHPLRRLCDASAALDVALADALDAALEPTAGIGEEEVAPTPPTATQLSPVSSRGGEGAASADADGGSDDGAAALPRLAVAEAWVARQVCAVLCGRSDERRRQGRRDAARCDDLLFCSNSLPIRHLDMFCAAAPTVLSNRGASGIDGILHTAIGAALGGAAGGGSATCLIGDLAALHDLNALALLSNTPRTVVVVVLNNAGGAIFRYLPIAHSAVFSPYFDTPHAHRFEGVCRGFGLSYRVAATAADLRAAYAAALDAGGPAVVEVITDKEDTYALHQSCVALAAEVGTRVFLKG
jgi:isochorismate synthase/2-succinyl-5-enolpyruvyl-6-hydroxy-3-cyclohexene-1-carboxylate synthase/2-succinyl-6-hydroxy-2,4-cyclohexadiene-1-carboxylate synthase/O-succinylbenzoate synthase